MLEVLVFLVIPANLQGDFGKSCAGLAPSEPFNFFPCRGSAFAQLTAKLSVLCTLDKSNPENPAWEGLLFSASFASRNLAKLKNPSTIYYGDCLRSSAEFSPATKLT